MRAAVAEGELLDFRIELNMPRQEALIQFQIAQAIRYYFESNLDVPRAAQYKVQVSIPASGAQAKKADDFGRKPYDIGFYVESTTVFFLEIKELNIGRPHTGRFEEYKIDQKEMLETVSHNGVDIRYAYNTWTLDRNQGISEEQILDLAHVRRAKEMTNSISYQPIFPAQVLREYLDALVNDRGGASKLVTLLDRDASHFDYLNGMPLMILMNLDDEHSDVLIALQPQQSLRMMKALFNLPENERDAKKLSLSRKKHGKELTDLAERIFSMRDAWVQSNEKSLRQRSGLSAK